MKDDQIEFDAYELEAAASWHGGQSSMLYAIASTGTLSRGTQRPTKDDGSKMDDDEWMIHLARGLMSEAIRAADLASSGEDDSDEPFLREIASKARAYVRVNKRVTQKEFDDMLETVMDEQGPASTMLVVPGVYEAVSEYFNNEVLDRIYEERKEND